MATINEVAHQFFGACEAGKSWEARKAFCTPNASFSSQADARANVRTLREYADRMTGLMKMMPDDHYDLKAFATDDKRANVIAYPPPHS